jgi:hypothetical protein
MSDARFRGYGPGFGRDRTLTRGTNPLKFKEIRINKIYKTRLETGFVYMLSTGNQKCVPMGAKTRAVVRLGTDISLLGIKGVGQARRLSYCFNLSEYCYSPDSWLPQCPMPHTPYPMPHAPYPNPQS